MSTLPRIEVLLLAAALVAGCGDKVPESEAARKIGMQPKQTVDKVGTELNKNLQQGAERSRDAEEKN